MKRKINLGFLVIVMSSFVFICYSSCKKSDKPTNPFPAPDPACCYYSGDYSLPQTQSEQQLGEYLSSEHFEHDLDGWFFFGSLIDDNNPSDTCVFFIEVQRQNQSSNGFTIPMIPAAMGFNSTKMGHYEVRGFLTIDTDPLMMVIPSPWHVTLSSPFQEKPLMEMSLLAGTMGAKGAVYKLEADIPGWSQNTRMVVDIQLSDPYGTINEGDGTASFFPQYLTVGQRDVIMSSSPRTISNYLETTGDPMNCQGSYYYSLPMLNVDQYSITIDDSIHSIGTKGLMWLDYVVESYDAESLDVFDGGSWAFYAIQIPEVNSAIMVLEVESKTGTLSIAKLYNDHSEYTANGARKADYTWAIDAINVEPVPGSNWTSPQSGKQYAMQHHIQLSSADLPADLYLTMIIKDQEIMIDEKNIQYEGLTRVEGTLGNKQVTGQAFVEIKAVGGFK